MSIPGFSIRRPVTVIMVVAVVLLLGFISFTRTPLDLMPDLEFPIAVIVTNYDGAGPREVENLVTRPIEDAVGTLAGLQGLTSTSQRGQSMVMAEFAWGTDMNFAALDIREAIDMVRPILPDDADSPMLMTFDPSMIPVMALTLSGDMGPADLRNFAEDVIRPRLERLGGVASVGVSGGLEREIKIELNPGRMEIHRVSLDQVFQVLQTDNMSQPGGTVLHREREYLLSTTGEYRSVEQLSEVLIPTLDGGTIALRHIADVHDAYKDVSVLSRLNFEPSVGLSIQKEADANTVQVARAVRNELARIQSERSGIQIAVVIDQAEMIEDSLANVAVNGLVGAVMAGAVLLLFLRSGRAIAVIIASIPLAIIATFVMIYFAGMSLNIISLGGLALGIGMLVDNAIVVLENIYRKRSQGLAAVAAAEEGTNEVASAIFASTLTTVSVFMPVVFVQGIARQISQDMAFTVSFSLIASLAVALTLVPLLAAKWLTRRPQHTGRSATDAAGGEVLEADRQLGGLQRAYMRLLGGAMRRRGWVLGGMVVLLVGSLAMMPLVGSEFIPSVDQSVVSVRVELPIGSRLSDTDRVVAELEELIYAIAEVESVYASIGGGGQLSVGGASAEAGTIEITLVPLRERSRSSFEVAEQIRQLAEDIPGALISVTAAGSIGGMGGAPLEVQVGGDDEATMIGALAQIADAMRQRPGVREVATSLEEERLEYRLEIRPDRARELGLSVPQVASAVRTAIDGQVATRYRAGGEEVDVRVRVGGTHDLDRLAYVPIWSPVAGPVPLEEVVAFTPGTVPTSLTRRDQARVYTVTADLFGRDLGSTMLDLQSAVNELDLPSDVFVTIGGEAQQMQDAFGDLAFALLLAVFLVYAILAAQFESLRHPFTIMLSVPLAAIGVVVGLVVTRTSLSVPAFIGLIILAGIVVNNAIVLVHYINLLRQKGMERAEAIIEAGRARLRPVLMTAITTILAMVPLALGIGEGAEIQAPMAIVVVFGLLFSTLLTLVVVPLMYVSIDNIGRGRRERRRIGVPAGERPSGVS